MKKTLVALAVILVGLAVLLPFASSSPDALEKVTSTFGATQQPSGWQGLMPDYTVTALGGGYASTLLAAVFGIVVVLAATLLLGKVMFPKNTKPQNKT